MAAPANVAITGRQEAAEGHVVFRIDVQHNGRAYTVWHRYNDFLSLSQSIACPVALPPKSNFRKHIIPGFMDQRQQGLDMFLRALVQRDPYLTQPWLQQFLQESVYRPPLAAVQPMFAQAPQPSANPAYAQPQPAYASAQPAYAPAQAQAQQAYAAQPAYAPSATAPPQAMPVHAQPVQAMPAQAQPAMPVHVQPVQAMPAQAYPQQQAYAAPQQQAYVAPQQQAYAAPQQQAYATPPYQPAQPMYAQPVVNQPYVQPGYAQPSYGQPAYDQNCFGQQHRQVGNNGLGMGTALAGGAAALVGGILVGEALEHRREEREFEREREYERERDWGMGVPAMGGMMGGMGFGGVSEVVRDDYRPGFFGSEEVREVVTRDAFGDTEVRREVIDRNMFGGVTEVRDEVIDRDMFGDVSVREDVYVNDGW